MAHQACLVCLELAFASLDNKLLTSAQCGHKVCRRCLQQQQKSTNLPGSAAIALAAGATTANVVILCPVCDRSGVVDEWLDREVEESELEQEKLVRQRVMAVYNLTRINFEATPQYNDFLEKREEAVYGLVFGADESEKRMLQEELENYEVENQKQIVECRQQAVKEAENQIRDIVKKEGVFYEIVQQNFGLGFSYASSSRPTEGLTHSLQRSYPELFVSDTTGANNNANRTSHISSDVEGGIGAGGHPKPLQANINYNTLPKRQPTDKAALLRACGMSKDLIAQRVLLELWEGLKLGLPTE